MAKKRSRSAEPASRYRRGQLAKRVVINESQIATVVSPQAPSPLPMQTARAGRDENE